ncbi:MAG: CsiV family protein [Gammaproteobacteria bacterium]|tara:strand:+ start:18258 stop:18938 length:681 start_codon:yes stop_codon:yes gene_type:complete
MNIIFKNILLFFLLFSTSIYAEEIIDENQILYQIKIIIVSHNDSNLIEYNQNFISDKYKENDSISIKNNNCVINNENICVKYDNDYKLETFNEYKTILSKDNKIKLITHLEWVQNMNSFYNIKIKDGHDYSNEIFDDDLDLNDIDIIGSGKINQYEGFIKFVKDEFYTVNLILYERLKMKSDSFFSNNILVSKKHDISQRVKLNKTTYIDRDNFGLILKIIKIKKN